ncbi:MAG: hypothetical protein R3E08_10170 [Thiotrichaceae bacterium]
MSASDDLFKRLNLLELEQDRQREEVIDLAADISPVIGLKLENIDAKKSTERVMLFC